MSSKPRPLMPSAVAQAFADALCGLPMNGHFPQPPDPPWRRAIEDLAGVWTDPEQVRAMLGSVLETERYTKAEQDAAWLQITSTKPGTHKEPERPAVEVLSRSALRGRPRPEWLIAGHVQRRALSVLYGPSGIGKSFLAIQMACCVATGRPWFGRDVVQGPVVYVAGEGDDDIDTRITAWEREYWGGKMIGDHQLVVVPHSLDLRAASMPDALLKAVRAAMPVDPLLVFFDTLARNMTGDENSTEHMSQVVRQVDAVWQDTGAGVALVHHVGKMGESERGNSALRGAANTMMKLTRDEETRILKLSCDKQKNGREFDPWQFVLKEVVLGDDDESAEPITSCLIDLAAGAHAQTQLNPMQMRVLTVLGWPLHSDGVGSARLLSSLGVHTDTERVNVYRALNKLYSQELISKSGGARSQLFGITARGKDILHYHEQQASEATSEPF